MKSKVLDIIKEYFFISLGTLLLTSGVYFFKIPNEGFYFAEIFGEVL